MPPFPRVFPHRGEIYWVDFANPRGSEQGGRRPAIVVSNNINNQHAPVVVVAAITSARQKKRYPQNVSLPAGVLEDESTILGGQLLTVAKDRLEKYAAAIPEDLTDALDRALAKSLALPMA